VTRRELLPVALVLLVTICDAADVPTLSFYFLLAAVPAIVVAGLAAVEERLQEGAAAHRRAIGLLHVVSLVLVLVSAALRAPLRAEGTVPPAALSAVIACLAVFAAQGILATLPALRRGVRLRPPAVPEPTELPLP
jgi:protein-S-isoprenylcysteine O-methyltransferase Ste14